MSCARAAAIAAAVLAASPAFAANEHMLVVKRFALAQGAPVTADVTLPRGTTAAGIAFKGADIYCDDLKMSFVSGDPTDVLWHVAVPANFTEVYHFASGGKPSVVKSVHVECHATGAAGGLTVSAGK